MTLPIFLKQYLQVTNGIKHQFLLPFIPAGKSTCQNPQGEKHCSSETALPLLCGKAVSVGKNKAGTQQVVNFNQGFPDDTELALTVTYTEYETSYL